jgi:hypothetical protein
MAVFHCARFPDGVVPIRTEEGIVEFQDGVAEVKDAKLAAALRKVPDDFEITEDKPKPKK